MLDAFHVVKLILLAVDQVRRRVQQDSTGHRGRAGDPLYRVRRILRRRYDRLTDRQLVRLRAALTNADTHEEITAAWLVVQQVMQAYAIRTCPVPEIARFGRTLTAWRTEFLARFDHTQVSNGPTENLNLKIKNTKRTARGYRSFRN